MAFDKHLAERIRVHLAARAGVTERTMFGGIGFMLHGNMGCGVLGDELLVRMAPAAIEQALAEPGTRPFDMTGRPMKGWLFVGAQGQRDEATFAAWVARAAAHAASLPKK